MNFQRDVPLIGTSAPAQERDLVLAVDTNEQNLPSPRSTSPRGATTWPVVRDGREAFALYPQTNRSIIGLDVMMPAMDGYEGGARITGETGGRIIPILMLPALTDTGDKVKALECGADDLLNKPITRNVTTR